MARIPCQISLDAPRIAHRLISVKPLNRLQIHEARTNPFATAGISRHEMRLDEPRDDLQICPHESSIHAHRRLIAHAHMAGRVVRKMIDHLNTPEQSLPKHDLPLVRRARPVHPHADDDGNLLVSDSIRVQRLQ